MIEILGAIAALALGASALVADPVENFVANPPVYDIQPVDLSRSYRMDADLNGDGRKEVLLTHEGMRMGRGGCNWVVYLNELNGYRRLNFSVPDNYGGFSLIASTEDSIVFPGPDGTERIRTYWPEGSGQARLRTYSMNKEGRLHWESEKILIDPNDPFNALNEHYSVPVIASVLELDMSNRVPEPDKEKSSSQVNAMESTGPVAEHSTDSQAESVKEVEGATGSAGDPPVPQSTPSEPASQQPTQRLFVMLLVIIFLVTVGLGIFVVYKKRNGGE